MSGVGIIGRDNYQPLIFDIDIDMKIHSSTILADISSFSQFSDEQEGLFDIRTVYEIQNVDYIDIEKHSICMPATNECVRIAKDYLEFMNEYLKKNL
ncbi:unnamed protein product [Didymodactylos carnosus]|uniref:Uncharacterized protein n=1 Tax=Didymodactylos carnosus TaxID=1234261 RepID=A0A815GXB2_9BILA|nr:unnamed protein product [Didymodactylos carnosus]CAF1403557.1 unnamed protein product [Didymodactylos carnosus]CAF4207817.1 unnamed protein product [Didymodactylos carnosus]CAF4209916.1 unnamed protein product [Didymodactylos carnosus]